MIHQKILNIDCMEYMRSCDDLQFDLAICDPPYFANTIKNIVPGNLVSSNGIERNRYDVDYSQWDNNVPTIDYLNELKRISKHQIIFGINYFDFSNRVGSGRIIWDKDNDKSVFSHCEIASCSLIKSVRIFRYRWNGMIQQDMKNKQERIHPTQKPIDLYEWILANYAKTGDLILDTHSGSTSSAIACSNYGFEYVGCELDLTMANKSIDRLEEHKKQMRLFG